MQLTDIATLVMSTLQLILNDTATTVITANFIM